MVFDKYPTFLEISVAFVYGFWIIKSWVYIHKRFSDEIGNDDIGGESMFSPPTLAWQGHTWTPVARRWCGDVMSVNT